MSKDDDQIDAHEVPTDAELLELTRRVLESELQNGAALHLALGMTRLLAPVDAFLFCPRCGLQHVDAPDPSEGWTNPPHRTHRCAGCRQLWRPSDRDTNGVLALASGKPYVEPSGEVVFDQDYP